MGWLGDIAGFVGGNVAGGAGKVGGLLSGAAGKVVGGKAEDSVGGEIHPKVTGFDPSRDLGEDNALPGQNYFDPSVEKDLIAGQAGRDSKYFDDTFNHGLDPGDSGIVAPQGLPGSAGDPMVEAINNRAASFSADSIRGLKTRNHEQGVVQANDEQAKVAREASAVYQNKVANFNQQYQYQMQRYQMLQQYKSQQNAAQATLWGSVFGGIGKVAGIVAGAK